MKNVQTVQQYKEGYLLHYWISFECKFILSHVRLNRFSNSFLAQAIRTTKTRQVGKKCRT